MSSSKDLGGPTISGTQAPGGVRFGFSNENLNNKSMEGEDDEVEFTNQIQDIVSNSEMADTTELHKGPLSKTNLNNIS